MPPKFFLAARVLYRQQPLPEHIRAGYTLSEEDAAEVQTLQARRDQTIQFRTSKNFQIPLTVRGLP